jgi:DNA polymerase elongation subunit (family B)
MTIEQFEELADIITIKHDTETNPVTYKIVEKYDSQLFTFDEKIKYIEFTTNNPYHLKNVYESLKTELIRYYNILEIDELIGYDLSFYNQTESPFRNVQFTIDLNQIHYYLCCSRGVPCVGLINLNIEHCKKQVFTTSERNILVNNMYCVEYKYIDKTFIKSEDLDQTLYNSINIISYDIETYNEGVSELDSSKTDQPIICIGFSIFKLGDTKPLQRYCVISKDFDKTLTYEHRIENEIIGDVKTKTYYVKDYEEADDETIYHIVSTEDQILKLFIHYISKTKPYFISGFNNWTFDDKWIYGKCKLYNLDTTILKALTIYKQIDNTSIKTIDNLNGKYQVLTVKLDNEIVKGGSKDSYASWRQTFTIMHDTMFSALKEDPKRFSNRTRKNLDTMLEVYNILNPYNNGQLSKSGLKIIDMFIFWRKSINIYEIAKYCCQDAWITGTFAIKRNMYGDLMEMSIMTNTSTQDSVYRAVNIRVGNTIAKYAYDENFALFDIPDRDSRSRKIKSLLGNKFYDKRTLIGGMVKNKRNGREKFIVALDFSSMYPSQKEGSNVDTSSRVSDEIIKQPGKYNLKLINKYYMEDMYGGRWFFELQHIKTNKIYKVEQFFTEFKVDKSKIDDLREKYKQVIEQKIDQNYNSIINAFEQLIIKQFEDEIKPYHEEIGKSIMEFIVSPNEYIPNTVKVPLYFCQSPKDPETDLPIIHYSIKEKLLSDFRAKRSSVKKDMAKTNDPTIKIQLSAKEKAIKVVMNSEYGQTGSELFAHYDSDIGGAVTYGSRSCIMELTSCLYSEHFYVDESYVNNQYLNELIASRGSRTKSIASIDKIKYVPNWKLALEGRNFKLNEKIIILQRHTICPEKFNDVTTNTELEQVLNTLTKEELNTFVEFDYDKEFKLNSVFDYNTPIVMFNKIDFDLPPRRITLHDLYFKLRNEYESKNKIETEIYVITLPKSQLVYQDTDSNYYTNDTIVMNYPKLNPTTINEIMLDLISHNNLLATLIPDIIHRRPIGVGFEGAFIVARYLNKKKKYYGKKWNSKIKDYIVIKRDPGYNFNQYELDYITNTMKLNPNKLTEPVEIKYDWRNLPDDYETYLSLNSGDTMGNYNCYYSSIPYKDGSYFDANQTLIGDKDFIDYVNQCGIKCTGVDLARRDQYKFINYNHVLVIKNDMKYVNLDMNQEFKPNNLEIDNDINIEKFKLTPVIEKLLDDFINKSVPNYEYPLNYYAKFKVYKDNLSEVKPIVAKLKEYIAMESANIRKQPDLSDSEKDIAIKNMVIQKYVPEFGQRVNYVILDQFNDRVDKSGLNIYGEAVKDKGCLTSVAMYLFGGITESPENYTTADYFNQDTLDVLDYADYFKHLVTSLCNYMVVEYNPEIALYLDDDFILKSYKNEKDLEDEMNREISKIRNKITNDIYKKYYPNKKIKITGSNVDLKKAKAFNKIIGDVNNIIKETFDLENDLQLKNKYIYNSNVNTEILLKNADLNIMSNNIVLLNKRIVKLKENERGLNDIIKIDRLFILYNFLESMAIEMCEEYNKNKKFRCKIAIDSYMKDKIKFAFSYSVGIKWIGSPQSRIETKGEILGYKNEVQYNIFHSDRDFEQFISKHVESFEFTTDRKQFTIKYEDYDKLLNTLSMIFTNK